MVTVILGLLLYIFVLIIGTVISIGFPYPCFEKKQLQQAFLITQKNYFERQPGETECSGYASAYVYRHFGKDADGAGVFKNMRKHGYGENIVRFARANGFAARLRMGNITALKNTVAKGNPVIVLVRFKRGMLITHFTTVVGYDEEYFYLADSFAGLCNARTESEYYNRKVSARKFTQLWNICIPRVVSNLFIEIQRKDT